MNHQPYENWILDSLKINPEEQEALSKHMKACPECYKLHHSWNKVQVQLESTPVKPAPAVFVPRWKTQFAKRQKEQERRQARTLLISLGSGAGAIMIALTALLLPDFSVISLMVGFLTTVVRLFNSLDSLWSVIRGLVETAPTITLIITGLLMAGWISLAAFAWGISIWRITIKEVKTK
ncbi:MAG: hypothetical protein FD147_1761 [Chloroflexi bacterium]|nr:MAG: hypothetical protein FD147_1761 [Chloroflexota bacterium]MBA4377009.1 hypothetical protein [Anaerolinea sp.]